MNTFTDVNTIALEVMNYPISYVELIGTIFGFISVYLATQSNILTWATGIINEIFLFLLFYQVQLYADMFLQVFFMGVTIYGWKHWKSESSGLAITRLNGKSKLLLGIGAILATLLAGTFLSKLHLLIPGYFHTAAAYPFTDSLVMILSIIATLLLALKKIESWYVWIVVDILCVVLFFSKEIFFLSFESLVFLGLAIYGYYQWKSKLIDK